MAKMDNRRGLGEVRVSKADLIAKIQANLGQHTQDFEEGVAGWREELLSLAGEIASAKLHNDIELVEDLVSKAFRLPKPVSYVADYERALDKLNASQDEEFVLDEHSFDQFWRDEWNWKRGFAASVANYKK